MAIAAERRIPRETESAWVTGRVEASGTGNVVEITAEGGTHHYAM